MKRRVVLYNPYAEFRTMPLALLTIGSHLDRDRYEPVIVDTRLETDAAGAARGGSARVLAIVEMDGANALTAESDDPRRAARKDKRLACPDAPLKQFSDGLLLAGIYSLRGDEPTDEATDAITTKLP